MSAEAHSRGEDPRARAARHRGRAADLRKQAEIEEAWAAELDGEVRATSTTSAPDRERAPLLDVPGNDVSPPQPPPPADQLGAGEIESWGAAAPCTIDVYLDHWTDYFATDPCWYNIVCALKKRAESELDAPTHHVLCRRLAAAVAPMFVAASGADPIQSWGPAPPSTSADYATTWRQYIAALLGRARPEGSSAHGAPSGEQAPLIPPPPPAAPRPIDAEARAVLPTVTPSPATRQSPRRRNRWSRRQRRCRRPWPPCRRASPKRTWSLHVRRVHHRRAASRRLRARRRDGGAARARVAVACGAATWTGIAPRRAARYSRGTALLPGCSPRRGSSLLWLEDDRRSEKGTPGRPGRSRRTSWRRGHLDVGRRRSRSLPARRAAADAGC